MYEVSLCKRQVGAELHQKLHNKQHLEAEINLDPNSVQFVAMVTFCLLAVYVYVYTQCATKVGYLAVCLFVYFDDEQQYHNDIRSRNAYKQRQTKLFTAVGYCQ